MWVGNAKPYISGFHPESCRRRRCGTISRASHPSAGTATAAVISSRAVQIRLGTQGAWPEDRPKAPIRGVGAQMAPLYSIPYQYIVHVDVHDRHRKRKTVHSPMTFAADYDGTVQNTCQAIRDGPDRAEQPQSARLYTASLLQPPYAASTPKRLSAAALSIRADLAGQPVGINIKHPAPLLRRLAPMHITAHSLLGRRAAENWHARRRHG